MPLRFVTWNINSVRVRLPLLERLILEAQPDVVCLQEIKCSPDLFPREAVARHGYLHLAVSGQPGYHGVAILSRRPIAEELVLDLDASGHARHVAVALKGKGRRPVAVLHNFYVPSGGDIPDPELNPKFAQKLRYLDAMAGWSGTLAKGRDARAILVGDLNVAPLEHDVWSHRQMLGVVSHTPVEVDRLLRVAAAHDWHDVMRGHVPASEKLYTWWSYRARDWRASNRGRRLDHCWTSPALAPASVRMQVMDVARGWSQPSDHVPVVIDLELDA